MTRARRYLLEGWGRGLEARKIDESDVGMLYSTFGGSHSRTVEDFSLVFLVLLIG